MSDPDPKPAPHPARSASVTLRTEQQGDDSAVQLDAANQSLADALNLVFNGIKFAMLGLLVYFLFSGFQMVRETESGIRLLFGRVTGDNLSAGPQFSWPYPLGELIRVDTGAVTMDLDDSFMPLLTPDQKKLPLTQVAQQGVKLSLKPGEDGSLITGDSSLAHAKWRVLYRRERPRDFIENVLPEHEKQIVRAAVEQAVVKVVGTLTIDDLLKQSASDLGSVATRARELAQAALDKLKAGIKIEQLTLQDKIQPFSTFAEFNNVQSAEQKASERINNAQSLAQNILNEMAGAAYKPLVQQIDLYEAALERKDIAEQEKILTTIHALLQGEPVTIGDVNHPKMVSGRVTAMLNDANQYRSSIVSRRSAELSSFQAKLAQFRTNPEVMLQRDWADAMGELMNRQIVETYFLPPGADTIRLNINRDQDLAKIWDRIKRETDAEKIKKLREEAAALERLRTPTDQLELNAIPKAGSR